MSKPLSTKIDVHMSILMTKIMLAKPYKYLFTLAAKLIQIMLTLNKMHFIVRLNSVYYVCIQRQKKNRNDLRDVIK